MLKPFVAFLYASVLAGVVLAQYPHDAVITKPEYGDEVCAGSKIPVRITKQPSYTSSEDVSIEIAMYQCAESEGKAVCPGASATTMGDILLTHSYEPTSHDDGNEPWEEFEVTIPSWGYGPAQLGIQHVYKVWDENIVEYSDITVWVHTDSPVCSAGQR